jgi:hypothetical protein
MRIAMRNYSYVARIEPDRLKSGISNERYPARAPNDDMIFDRMLSAGRNFIGNLCRRWRFRDPPAIWP